ncbi:MAG: DUF222 domain-containing protein [Ilumatobacter sp.]|uniref:HNH endonuclease signature motif containing protein n=1 Tax=Ilumatobacter sp. TaxID=1967498 RepID=UPI00391DFA98
MKFSSVVEQVMELSPDEITARLREVELAERRLAVEKAALVAVADAVGAAAVDGHASTMGWLVANTNCSKASAVRVRQVSRLLNQIEQIADAFASGRFGVSQVEVLARAFAKRRGGDRLGEVADTLVTVAEHMDVEALQTCVRRWESNVDPDGAFDDIDASVAGRRAHVVELGGSIDIAASGGDPIVAAEMVAIFQRYVQAEFDDDARAARREHGPSCPVSLFARTAEQRRFDALAAIFRDAVVARVGGVASSALAAVMVNVVISQDRFEAALAEHGLFDVDAVSAPLPLAEQRCETSTGTVIPPSMAITAALTGRIRRVLLDRRGRVVNLGRTQRLFTGAAREAAALLPASCSWSGCFVPAELCDIDHLEEWERDHGPTDLDNAAPTCRRHNRFKSAKRYTARVTDLATIVHTRPDGTDMIPAGVRPLPDVLVESFPVFRLRLPNIA